MSVGTSTAASWQDATSQVIAGMLQWGANSSKAVDQQLFNMTNGANNLAESYRHGWKLMDFSAIAVIIQALLGSDPTLASNILSQRSVQAQPQTTGQLVSGPPFQVGSATPAVYSVNPATGAITKAA